MWSRYTEASLQSWCLSRGDTALRMGIWGQAFWQKEQAAQSPCAVHVQGHTAARTAFPILGLRPRLDWGSAGWTPQPWEASLLTLVAVDCFSLGFASGTRSLYKMGHHKRREREPTCSQNPGLPFCHEGASQSFAFSGGAGPPCLAQALPCSPDTRPTGAVQRLPTATRGP